MGLATENRVRFSRVWQMPNANTFSIPAINSLIHKYIKDGETSIDPFANSSSIASITNDIDPSFNTTYNLTALDFLNLFSINSIDSVLFDPPYSSRQVSEVYKKMGLSVNMETTQSSFWTVLKNQISRIVKPNGIVISFGWNSNGIGTVLGFELLEVLLVAHGGAHNDTIVTVERKISSTLF